MAERGRRHGDATGRAELPRESAGSGASARGAAAVPNKDSEPDGILDAVSFVLANNRGPSTIRDAGLALV